MEQDEQTAAAKANARVEPSIANGRAQGHSVRRRSERDAQTKDSRRSKHNSAEGSAAGSVRKRLQHGDMAASIAYCATTAEREAVCCLERSAEQPRRIQS